MYIIEIMRAYELFQSHGLDMGASLNDDLQFKNKNIEDE